VKVKQVIVVRKDLNMRRGKEVAQGSHGSCMWMANRWREYNERPWWKKLWYLFRHGSLKLSEAEKEWLVGRFTKVVVQVNSEDELLAVFYKAKEKGLLSNLVVDSGATEFNGVPTSTVVAIGPNFEEDFVGVTDTLKLY
jgi:PTH2 family peptidyl-tRNA hydrolase